MLPTFVIGLREGLEAALIVGIIAAFLRKQGRRDLLRWVFVGIAVAVGLCVSAGVALTVLSHDLPQKQQEGLETVIGALAVAMVTYMVVWMRRNSRGLKGQLEGLAADALGGASGAARAMVVMAFLAVLREGVETVVFLLAAFDQSAGNAGPAVGACLGLAVAAGLGYGIYRGGVRLNLSKFFRATGLVLVFVAAGIVVNALRTAHEAGWLTVGQQRTVDLTWLVEPGSVQSSLLTGMLGVQPRPVLVELIGWLVYLVPVGLYVAWKPGHAPSRAVVSRLLVGAAAVLGVGAAVLALVLPDRPATRPATAGVQVLSLGGDRAVLRTVDGRLALARSGAGVRDGLAVHVYAVRTAVAPDPALPAAADVARVAELNGGRLPIGLKGGAGSTTLRYAVTRTTTAWVEPRTGAVVDLRTRTVTTASVLTASGTLPLTSPVAATVSAWPAATSGSATGAARSATTALDRRALLVALSSTAGVLAALLLAAGRLFRPRRDVATPGSPEEHQRVRLASPN